MTVDDAEQHGLFIMAERTQSGKLRGTVLQLGNDVVGDLLCVGGDDGDLAGGLGTPDDVTADKTGHEAVKNTKTNRLVVIDQLLLVVGLGINKERDNGHKGVEDKGHPEKIQRGVLDADVLGDDVGAAGRGIGAEADSVDKSADHAAQQHGEDGVVSLCIILELRQADALQIQKRKGIGQTEYQAAGSKITIYKKVGKNTKRHIDQQRHIADTEAGFVLHHSGNAIETGRSKPIFYDKQLVVEGQQNRHEDNQKIGKEMVKTGIFRKFQHNHHPTTM